jgi:hypothetical protein
MSGRGMRNEDDSDDDEDDDDRLTGGSRLQYADPLPRKNGTQNLRFTNDHDPMT